LHDLSRDPDELENRIDDPDYGDILKDLERELARILHIKPMVPKVPRAAR
jgi:hypothetical protein